MATLPQPPVSGSSSPDQASTTWTSNQKVVFRFVFLYFVLQAVPLDWRFYRDLLSIDWESTYYRDLFYLARYAPHFFGPVDTFANWGVVALMAGAGTLAWSLLVKREPNYDVLYYGLRVILRYRLAIGVIAYGFIKLFPLQAPLPSISHLNTAYGDFTAWKLFSLSLGVVPWYESILGGVEILGGLLLLNRKTTVIGTLIILPFTGNVFVSNLAYEGGEYVYSLLLISFALVLFAYDGIRLFRLVSLELPAQPNQFHLPLSEPWQRSARLVLKSAFIFFAVLLFGYKTYAAYRTGPYQYPQIPGLAGAAGLYNVSEFRLNGQVLPYSKTDTVRWQNVVFENWNTLSIQTNRPATLYRPDTEEIPAAEAGRDYELAGTQGRYYYRYQVDSSSAVLSLKNAHPQADEALTLAVKRPNENTIVLSGSVNGRDSVYVVLNRIDKKYLLHEAARLGRRGTLKL